MRLFHNVTLMSAPLLAILMAASAHACASPPEPGAVSPAPQAIPTPNITSTPEAVKPATPPSPSLQEARIPTSTPEILAATTPTVNTSSKANPEEGKKLFYATGCIGCHMAEGIGGNVGPDLTQVGKRRDEAYIEKSIREPKAYIVPGYTPVMPSAAELGLKDEDIAHIIAWLLTLK